MYGVNPAATGLVTLLDSPPDPACTGKDTAVAPPAAVAASSYDDCIDIGDGHHVRWHYGLGPPGAVKQPQCSLGQRQMDFVWHLCKGVRGAERPKMATSGPGRGPHPGRHDGDIRRLRRANVLDRGERDLQPKRRAVVRPGRRRARSHCVPLCTAAHPRYTRFMERNSASLSEATMRPHPRSTTRCCGTTRSSTAPRTATPPVRALRGRLSDLSVLHSKPALYGVFVWARGSLNNQKRRFPARAVASIHTAEEGLMVCRRAWARATMNQFSHWALQPFEKHRGPSNMLSNKTTGEGALRKAERRHRPTAQPLHLCGPAQGV